MKKLIGILLTATALMLSTFAADMEVKEASLITNAVSITLTNGGVTNLFTAITAGGSSWSATTAPAATSFQMWSNAAPHYTPPIQVRKNAGLSFQVTMGVSNMLTTNALRFLFVTSVNGTTYTTPMTVTKTLWTNAYTSYFPADGDAAPQHLGAATAATKLDHVNCIKVDCPLSPIAAAIKPVIFQGNITPEQLGNANYVRLYGLALPNDNGVVATSSSLILSNATYRWMLPLN